MPMISRMIMWVGLNRPSTKPSRVSMEISSMSVSQCRELFQRSRTASPGWYFRTLDRTLWVDHRPGAEASISLSEHPSEEAIGWERIEGPEQWHPAGLSNLWIDLS